METTSAPTATASPDVPTHSGIDCAYDAFVNELAQCRDGRTIANTSKPHSLSILRSIFRHAEEYVKILSGSFSPDYYSDAKLLAAVKDFVVKRRGTVEVLLQDSRQLDNVRRVFAKVLATGANGDSRGRVRIYSLAKDDPLRSASQHFTIADDRIYRLQIDPKDHSTVCSFNDSERATDLRRVFDSHRASAVPMKPSEHTKTVHGCCE